MKKIQIAFFCIALLSFTATGSFAQVSVGISISANTAPPPLPIYTQPPCPYDGYLWTPGYWGYGDMGYYWVPGAWVRPPQIGYLWTPCYWGFAGGIYGWHPGYWGRHVGFYGGVNYGYGYGGVGFGGGMWRGNAFRYNTAVMNVNTTVVRNTYVDRTVINNTTVINRTSFNGRGGIEANPRPEDEVAMRENHIQATSAQVSRQQSSSRDRRQFASVNHGQPTTAVRRRVNGNRSNPQGVRQPKASTGERPDNVNRQNRNIENQPQRERVSQPHPQKSMQRQERMEQPHQQQRAQRSEKSEQVKEKHG
ncbi:MAG: hypothetical protein ABI374_02550 [Ginsengibacter sp.]